MLTLTADDGNATGERLKPGKIGGPTDDFTRDEFAWRVRSRVESTDDGRAIRLAPEFDHLVYLMEAAIDDPGFRWRALISGPSFVAADYSWARAVDRLVDVLMDKR